MALFAGAKFDVFSVGAEYNSSWNAGFVENSDLYGYSVYAKVNLPKNFELFLRCDAAEAKRSEDKSKEEQVYVAGVNYTPEKHIKLAPNVQIHRDSDGNNETYLFLNASFSL